MTKMQFEKAMRNEYLRKAMVEAARHESRECRPHYVFAGHQGWLVDINPPPGDQGFYVIQDGRWRMRDGGNWTTPARAKEEPSQFIQGLKQVAGNVAAGRPWWRGPAEPLNAVKALAEPPREQWEIDRDCAVQRAIECAEHEAKYEPGHGY
jgi:hypothetical protein